jgi:FkbH-like protein
MELSIGIVNDDTLPRVVQLLAKTNQFNLTTRRHSSAELQHMISNGAIALWAKLTDRFGDNGLIAAAIAVPESTDTWRLDTFLMSCRVIGRGVETALLKVIEDKARAAGATTLLAEFISTDKNQPAADLLPVHGFESTGTHWSRPLSIERASPDYLNLVLD